MLAWVFSNASLDFILLFLSVKPECVHDGPVTLGVVPKRDAEVSFLCAQSRRGAHQVPQFLLLHPKAQNVPVCASRRQ